MVSSIGGWSGGFNMSAIKQMQQRMFKAMDANGDGKVDKNELSAFQKTQQANGKQGGPSVDEIFKKSDSNSDGGITLQEMQDSIAKIAQQMMQGQTTSQTQGASNSDPMAQMKANFDDLGSALKSGNISDAKAAFAKLQQNAPSQGSQPSEIESLSKALDSGNLKGAQAAYSSIQDKMSQGPQGMMAADCGQTQGSSAQDDVIKTLLAALNKEDDSNSSSTSRKKHHNQTTSSTDSTSSVKDMLASAIKSYSSQWGNSYAQNATNATSLASSVYG
jgi:hypothetical protein